MLISVLKDILNAYKWKKKKKKKACLVMYFPSSHLNLNKCFRVAYKSVSSMCSNNWESVEQDFLNP